MAINAFAVVSEFKFDVAQAMVESSNLQKNVNELSRSVDQAGQSVKNLGIGFLANFSGATGGILGILGNALKASDKFKMSQIEIANAMTANKMTIGGSFINFEQAMASSSSIMDDIVKKARGLKISPNDLLSQTKFFTNALAPKGLAGDNLSQAVELARVSMKAAPALGVSSEQATGGILSGASGQLSRNTQFGRRLFLEAGDAIKKATGGVITDIKSFNKASGKMRVKAMIKGLDKLAGTSNVVAARAETLGAAMMNIRDLFTGMGSILKPLGDSIMKPLLQILNMVSEQLQTNGLAVVKALAKIVDSVLAGPKEMFLQFITLQGLAADAAKAAGLATLTLSILHFFEGISALRKIPILGQVVEPLYFFANAIKRTALDLLSFKNVMKGARSIFAFVFSKKIWTAIKFIGRGINWISSGLIHLAAGFLAFLAPLMGLRRAFARMQLDSVDWLAKNMLSITEGFDSIKNSLMRFAAPFLDVVQGFEEIFYTILGGTRTLNIFKFILDGVVSILDSLSNKFLEVWALFRSIVAGLTFAITDLLSGGIPRLLRAALDGNSSAFDAFGREFMSYMGDEFDKTLNQYTNPLVKEGKDTQNNVKNVTNMKVTMNNAFKEVLQPDRIAFTIQDQLEKVAQNKRRSRSQAITSQQARSI